MVAVLNPGARRPSVEALNPQNNQKSFFVRSQNVLVRVKVKDIRYIHADGNYCYLFTEQKKYAIKLSLTRLMDRLPNNEFLRIHKSYIVQLKEVNKIDLGSNSLCLK
ncbi:LytTR family transcriptional regulator [Okeania hirsuta]|uniref:LytTR family transcriptional regulator n=1 Tax=Okeania hirsuta TaxID=1458930 RepID=A0A3N6PC47_9CYAN|nr:LytTR family transcriptional regulator [Okeania hirsuta]